VLVGLFGIIRGSGRRKGENAGRIVDVAGRGVLGSGQSIGNGRSPGMLLKSGQCRGTVQLDLMLMLPIVKFERVNAVFQRLRIAPQFRQGIRPSLVGVTEELPRR